jgi:hypothetical protein
MKLLCIEDTPDGLLDLAVIAKRLGHDGSVQMHPNLSALYLSDESFGHTKISGNVSLGACRRSDGTHLFFGDLCRPAPLTHTIPQVVGICPEEQV